MFIKSIKKENTTYSLFKVRGNYIIRAIKENGDISIFLNMDIYARNKKPYFGKKLTCLHDYIEFAYIDDDMFCNEWTGEIMKIEKFE